MDGSQQFRLKWDNYHVNMANSFNSLRLDEDFVDVTVACDGFQTKAHKMVLSACSPYFRDLLTSNPHPHPIVILRDVGRRHLQLLLDYMYRGEVNVPQAQLADFLKVAELLKVKGLADFRPAEEATAADTSARPRTVRDWADDRGRKGSCLLVLRGRAGPESPSSVGEAPPEKRRRISPPAGRVLKQEPEPIVEPVLESMPEPEQEQELELEPEPEPELKLELTKGLPELRLQDGLGDSPPTDLSIGQPSGPGPSAALGCDAGQDSPLSPDPVNHCNLKDGKRMAVLRTGDCFSSFGDLEARISALETETYSKFFKFSAMTLTNFLARSPIHYIAKAVANHPDKEAFLEEKKYRMIKFACTHGGRNYAGKADRVRIRKTKKLNCPVFITVMLDKSLQLVVKRINLEHSHAVSKASFMLEPENRRLTEAEKNIVRELHQVGADKMRIRQHLMDRYGKHLTRHDLNNVLRAPKSAECDLEAQQPNLTMPPRVTKNRGRPKGSTTVVGATRT